MKACAIVLLATALVGQEIPKSPSIATATACGDLITFHGSSKSIKDIFPEECGVGSEVGMEARGNPVWVDPIGGKPMTCKPREHDNWDYWDCRIDTREAEKQDVLAILISTHMSFENCKSNVCFDTPVNNYSCADKSRILLTSEDGKKWCHKVEP